MTTLDSGFEDALRESLLDDVETQAREIGETFMQNVEDGFRSYAARNDYDIDHVWDEVEGPHIERDDHSVRIRVEWPGLTALFEWGVDPHTISGNPLLHFYWEAKAVWITTESVNWGSETGGIPEARAIRNALEEHRRELEA